MIDIIREVRETSDENQGLKDLDMRIGIHTGKVVAGIIGSKVVRYDIFGEGVLIANKMESNGVGGKVCVSEDTRKILMQQQDIMNEYQMDEHKTINLHSINKQIKSYTIERKERDSIESDMLSSAYGKSLEQGSKNSKSDADLDSESSSKTEDKEDLRKKKEKAKKKGTGGMIELTGSDLVESREVISGQANSKRKSGEGSSYESVPDKVMN